MGGFLQDGAKPSRPSNGKQAKSPGAPRRSRNGDASTRQALALRTGLKKPRADLQRREQTHAECVRFLKGSQRRLAELERTWSTRRYVPIGRAGCGRGDGA